MSYLSVFALATSLFAAACSNKIADGSTDGAQIYQEACARCHGPDGKPIKAMMSSGVKSLKTERMRESWPDEQIRERILRGSANGKMPAFQGALSDEQVVSLIAYIRELAQKDIEGAAELVK